MKQLSLAFILILLAIGSVQAHRTVRFATGESAPPAWTLSQVSGNWQFSFTPGSPTVVGSTPSDIGLIGDYVNLPTMTLTRLADRGTLWTELDVDDVGEPFGEYLRLGTSR